MKLSHNKKRNSAFLYEMLIKELSKASMKNLTERKKMVLDIMKSYFFKDAPLKKELEIYNSFKDISECDVSTVEKIITEAKRQSEQLNKEEVYDCQTRIINTINKKLGSSCWSNFVSDYKKIATINQTIFRKSNPKKQVFMEQKLTTLLTTPRKEKQQFPVVNNLALKTFLERFNGEYTDSLAAPQKRLLNEYITSYKDDGASLKAFVYNEVGRLKEELQPHIEASPKIKTVLERINNYTNKEVNKDFVSEIIKIQALVEELNNVN
jgi:hypothetical protein